jgi:tryptophan synthase alpha chain
MTRIAQCFDRLRQADDRALIAYLTAGDPSPQHTPALVAALEAGGADIIELGVPFSDPIADGPVIQRASERALRAGTSLRTVLDLVREIRRQSQVPLVIFTYLNPVVRYGFPKFAADFAAAGADGALLIDLSVEEADPFVAEMRRHHLDTIFLAAPTSTDHRLKLVAQYSTGFIYLVSRTGVTGEQEAISNSVAPLIRRVRAVSRLPLAVGFGIHRPEHLTALAPLADAAAVGSAFMRLIGDHQDDPALPERLRDYTAGLKAGFRKLEVK